MEKFLNQKPQPMPDDESQHGIKSDGSSGLSLGFTLKPNGDTEKTVLSDSVNFGTEETPESQKITQAKEAQEAKQKDPNSYY